MTREQLKSDLIRYRCTNPQDANEMMDQIDEELNWRIEDASYSRRTFMLLPPGDLILERFKQNGEWRYELRRM